MTDEHATTDHEPIAEGESPLDRLLRQTAERQGALELRVLELEGQRRGDALAAELDDYRARLLAVEDPLAALAGAVGLEPATLRAKLTLDLPTDPAALAEALEQHRAKPRARLADAEGEAGG